MLRLNLAGGIRIGPPFVCGGHGLGTVGRYAIGAASINVRATQGHGSLTLSW